MFNYIIYHNDHNEKKLQKTAKYIKISYQKNFFVCRQILKMITEYNIYTIQFEIFHLLANRLRLINKFKISKIKSIIFSLTSHEYVQIHGIVGL